VEKLPLLALSVCASILTYQAQHAAGVVATLEHEPLLDRLANAAVSYVRYLGKTAWPVHLSAFYPLQPSWPMWAVFGSVALLAGITVGCALQSRRRPYLIVGWFWFLGTMVPVIGIVQAGNQSIADRYLYLPLIGLAIMLAWSGRELFVSRRWSREIVPTAAAASLLAAAIVAHHQVGFWRNTRTLFEHALFVINSNAEAHVKLGVLDAQQGDTTAAAQHYEAAIAADHRYYIAEFDYGNLLLDDHPERAIQHYRRATALAPGVAAIHNNWGFALLRLNRPGEAFDQFARAAQIDPGSFDAHYNLGQLLLAAGRKEQAAAEFTAAMRIDPENSRARRGYAAATAP
jgi:tetratricopeptide (TPR) repeat protein